MTATGQSLTIGSMPSPSRQVQLMTGEVAVIDEADWPVVSYFRWRYSRTGRAGPHAKKYVMAAIGSPRIYLHRIVMGSPKGAFVDHIDGDPLNCRRANLRLVTKEQNAQNRRAHRTEGRTSKFRGVSWDKKARKWQATIYGGGTLYRLGWFTDDQLAAAVYDDASFVLHGEYGTRNFPARTPQPIELRKPVKQPEDYGWRAAALRGEIKV